MKKTLGVFALAFVVFGGSAFAQKINTKIDTRTVKTAEVQVEPSKTAEKAPANLRTFGGTQSGEKRVNHAVGVINVAALTPRKVKDGRTRID